MLIINKKDRVELNGMKVFLFSSPKELLGYVDSHKGILVAVNAEKSQGKLDEYKNMVDNILYWTIQNMQDKKGYFYYQLKKGISSKISYLRWSNAFVFNMFTLYFRETLK